MKTFLFIGFILISFASFGQDTTLRKVDTNSVVVHKDSRIDLLVQKQAEINEVTSRDARRTGKGYRLLVINTNKRDEAVAAKTKMYTYFPELKSYLIYQSPFYKLKVGNFKERKEAEEYLQRLKKYFPEGVYIMSDTIELKLEKDNETVSRN
jgi:hypothetical protein